MSSTTYQNLDNRFANLECRTLNPLGYIPLVSTFSGAARVALGSVQTVAGNTLAGFFAFGYFITGDREHRHQAAAHHWHAVHGGLNITRGLVEMIPIVGNITTMLYDNGTRLRANYTFEHVPRSTLPLFDDRLPEIIGPFS